MFSAFCFLFACFSFTAYFYSDFTYFIGTFFIYAFIDTFFGKSYLRYNIETKELLLQRKGLHANVKYQGFAEKGQISIQKRFKQTSTRNSQPKYQVILIVSMDDLEIEFLLEKFSTTEDNIDAKLNEWHEKLKLT